MYCQMIRVISSPSISATGLTTLIFAMERGTLAARNGWESDGKRCAAGGASHRAGGVAIAPASRRRKSLASYRPGQVRGIATAQRVKAYNPFDATLLWLTYVPRALLASRAKLNESRGARTRWRP